MNVGSIDHCIDLSRNDKQIGNKSWGISNCGNECNTVTSRMNRTPVNNKCKLYHRTTMNNINNNTKSMKIISILSVTLLSQCHHHYWLHVIGIGYYFTTYWASSMPSRSYHWYHATIFITTSLIISFTACCHAIIYAWLSLLRHYWFLNIAA